MHKFLSIALVAAKKAGIAILEVYDSEFDVISKADKTPLTEADCRAHEIIAAVMAGGIEVPLPLLSEEGKGIDYPERKTWNRFWLIDPLDGTKEFVKRNGEFTVNIALIENGRPVMGVIFVPVKNTFYFGGEGLGAFRLTGSRAIDMIDGFLSGEPADVLLEKVINASEKLPLDMKGTSGLTIVGSRSHSTKALEAFVEEMKQKHAKVDFVSAGSSLKLCLVAEGDADIYPRLGPTMEWDTAAGHAIVEASGGRVFRADNGDPLMYNKENLLNPWFVAVKNGLEDYR